MPWKGTQEALDRHAGDYAKYVYPINTPSALSRSLGVQAECINASCSSPQRQESVPYVSHVYEGKGRTVLDTGGVMEWKACDTFVIPSWISFRHECSDSEVAFLFTFTDMPILQVLGCIEVVETTEPGVDE
jgi:gentisate 1,2-dioxygenase